jgi:hypothetical protein
VSTFSQRADKAVDALGATAHVLSWALLVVESALAAAAVLGGVVVAARWTSWGWTLAAFALAWLTGLLLGWWRPLLWSQVVDPGPWWWTV